MRTVPTIRRSRASPLEAEAGALFISFGRRIARLRESIFTADKKREVRE